MNYSPYSFSKISCFQHCPQKFKLKHIDKISIQSENIALEKGSYIHHVIENHIIGNEIPPFTFKLSTLKDKEKFNKIIIDFLKSDFYKNYKNLSNKFVERGFSLVIKDGKVVSGEHNKTSAIRGFIDFIHYDELGKKLLIVDWKSGKFKENINELQVKIYAVWGLLEFDVDYIETEFCFVEYNKIVSKKFTRSDLQLLQQEIFTQIWFIEKAEKFKKNPSTLCQWCEYKKENYCDGNYDFSSMNIRIGI